MQCHTLQATTQPTPFRVCSKPSKSSNSKCSCRASSSRLPRMDNLTIQTPTSAPATQCLKPTSSRTMPQLLQPTQTSAIITRALHSLRCSTIREATNDQRTILIIMEATSPQPITHHRPRPTMEHLRRKPSTTRSLAVQASRG